MAGNILYIAFIFVIFREQTYRAAAAEVQEPDNPISWLMQQCEKNDDSARATTAMKSFKLCIGEINNGEITPLLPQKVFVEFLVTLCDKSEALLKCVKQWTYDVKPCFTAEDRLEIANVLSDRIANFICVEKTSMIKEFIANGHICFDDKEKTKDLGKCLDEFGVRRTLWTNDHHIFNIGKMECALLSEYQTCVVQQLRSCPEPIADFVSSFGDTILEGLSCNRALSFGMSLGRFTLMCATAIVAVTAISFK